MTISSKLNPTNRYSKLNGVQVPWGYKKDEQDSQLLHPIEEQLEALLPPYEKPLFQYDKLQFIPKYLESLKLRIEKYPQRIDHDQECISQYNRIKNKWVEKVLGFVENELEIPKVYIDFQWKLQELRVSFFAQELKTNSPISVKRMDNE